MADTFLVPYVRAVWRTLRYRLGRTGRVCLFGAGEHTRWLVSVISDLPGPTVVCILDDQPKTNSIAGLPVRQPDSIDIDSVDLVLVSSDRWEEKLYARCKQLWGDRVEILRLYEGLPRGPYDKTDDRSEALRRIESTSLSRTVTDRQIVIVSDQPRAREAKLGYALKHAGWQPVLLCGRRPTFDAARDFDEVCPYSNRWEALRVACDFAPVAYHVMVNSVYDTAELFVRHRPGVVIIDSYDLIAGMYTPEYLAAHPALADELNRERTCLEQADGICTRSREPDYLRDHLGYATAPCFFFPDGCWNRTMPRRTKRTGPVHMVYAGNVSTGLSAHDCFARFGNVRAWMSVLAGQGLQVHLYPSWQGAGESFDATFSEYRDLERQYDDFHLHRPVPADHMVEELAQYDLSIFVYHDRIFPSSDPDTFTAAKLCHCTSNKIYDYIDAGLPIIHNVEKNALLYEVMSEYDVGIDVSSMPIERWGDYLRGLRFEERRPCLARARAAYDIRRHVPKLIEFYDRIRRARDAHHAPSRSMALGVHS